MDDRRQLVQRAWRQERQHSNYIQKSRITGAIETGAIMTVAIAAVTVVTVVLAATVVAAVAVAVAATSRLHRARGSKTIV